MKLPDPPPGRNFNPRPPRGGRRPRSRPAMCRWIYFNPRPPRGGRLKVHRGCKDCIREISIHAPREGGDFVFTVVFRMIRDFNPRPPRGGRHHAGYMPTVQTRFQSTPPARGATTERQRIYASCIFISIHAPREGGDSKDAQFYLRIFDKQVELLRFLGKIRGGCLRNPEKDRRFLGKSLANLPEISGHLDFAGGGKAHPGYPCAVPLPRRAACVRGSGDPPADRCSSYRNAPLFSHIASLDSKSADCLSQNP